MNPEEQLRQWFITLSEMIDGQLAEEASLGDGLEWFGSLPDASLAELQELRKANSNLAEFLRVGQRLMVEVNRE